VQGESVLLVPRADDGHRIRRQIGRPRNLRDDPAIGSRELKLAVRLAFYLVAFLVDRAMVPTTEHGEVRERCRAAVGPVADVMALAEAHAAAGKRQPWSRYWSALRIAGGIVRVRAPTSVTRPSASWRMTTLVASQARRCDVPAGTRMPSSSTDCPV